MADLQDQKWHVVGDKGNVGLPGPGYRVSWISKTRTDRGSNGRN